MFAIKSFPAREFTVNRHLTMLRKRMLRISLDEVTFTRRGFYDEGRGAMTRLEHVGTVFLHGYHAALNDEGCEALASDLDTIEREFRGFAYEGAAMGLALLDQLSLRNHNRLLSFLNGVGSKHTYMIHVGVGWAIARVPWLRGNLDRAIAHLDPLLRWLAADGKGFSDFYFGSSWFLTRPERLNRLKGYARQAYAQGVGRSLWFVMGANVDRITRAISTLPQQLHGDLWSGAGLACAMAGGSDCSVVERLRTASGNYRADMAQGAAFAAKTRQRAGSLTEHTEMACQVICGLSANAAAELTDQMLLDLPEDAAAPSYEIWRRRIQSQLPRR